MRRGRACDAAHPREALEVACWVDIERNAPARVSVHRVVDPSDGKPVAVEVVRVRRFSRVRRSSAAHILEENKIFIYLKFLNFLYIYVRLMCGG